VSFRRSAYLVVNAFKKRIVAIPLFTLLLTVGRSRHFLKKVGGVDSLHRAEGMLGISGDISPLTFCNLHKHSA
jgi:hypothetical protein